MPNETTQEPPFKLSIDNVIIRAFEVADEHIKKLMEPQPEEMGTLPFTKEQKTLIRATLATTYARAYGDLVHLQSKGFDSEEVKEISQDVFIAHATSLIMRGYPL